MKEPRPRGGRPEGSAGREPVSPGGQDSARLDDSKIQPFLQSKAEALGDRLVKQLTMACRAVTLYPADHPGRIAMIESLQAIMGKAMKGRKEVTLARVGSELVFQGETVQGFTTIIDSFARSLKDREIGTITFHAGVDLEELKKFTEFFSLRPGDIEKRGGPEAALQESGVHRIRLEQYQYSVTKPGQEVTDGDGSGGEDGAGEGTGDEPSVELEPPPAEPELEPEPEPEPEELSEEQVLMASLKRVAEGTNLDLIPDRDLGRLFRALLGGDLADREDYRISLAQVLIKLDPKLIALGLLEDLQKQDELAWSTIRQLMDQVLRTIQTGHLDARLEALQNLNGLIRFVLERPDTLGSVQTVLTARLASEEPDLDICHALGESLTKLGLALNEPAHLIQLHRLVQSFRELASPDTGAGSGRAGRMAPIARRALEELSHPGLVRSLVEHLSSSRERTVQMAGQILVWIADDGVTSRLIEGLEAGRVRPRAQSLLGEIGPAAVPLLLDQLAGLPDGTIFPRSDRGRNLTDSSLNRIRGVLNALTEIAPPELTDRLAAVLEDPDQRVRREVLLSLIRKRVAGGTSMALKALKDKEPPVVETALALIGQSPDPAVGPNLTQLFYQQPAMRTRVLHLLGRVGGPASRQFLSTAIHGEDAELNQILRQKLDLFPQILAAMVQEGSEESIQSLHGFTRKWKSPVRRMLTSSSKRPCANRWCLDEVKKALRQVG